MAVTAEVPVEEAVPSEPTRSYDGRAEATRHTSELFEWAAYVHAGAGAKECEHGEDGACRQPEHFHCWLRMPNPFQAKDITDKANAARARQRRALKQVDDKGNMSDAKVSLEDWLDQWLDDDETYQSMLSQIANRRVADQVKELRQELLETSEFEHYFMDLEELRRLQAVDEADRDPEEFERIEKHVKAFSDALDKRTIAEYEREMHELGQMAREDAIEVQRRARIRELADARFIDVFYQWAYFICALKPTAPGRGWPSERVFASPEALRAAPDETVKALRDTYRRLESGTIVRSDVAGN